MTRTQFAVMLLVAGVAGLLGGAASDWTKGRTAFAQEGPTKVVVAEQFRVVDATGKTRGIFGGLAQRGMPLSAPGDDDLSKAAGLVIGDRNGKERIVMGVAPMRPGQPEEGAKLSISDEGQKALFAVGFEPDGKGGLGFSGEQGVLAKLSVDPVDGLQSLSVGDTEGKERFSLTVRPGETGELALYDGDGNPVWSAP